MALLGFGQSLGKREQGGIGCDEVTTTTGHRIGDSVSAVAAQCDGVGVTLLSQAEERERVGGERFLHYSDQSGVESRPQQKDSTGKDPVHSIQPHMSELARLTVFQVDLIVLS